MNHLELKLRRFLQSDQEQVKRLIIDGLSERFPLVNPELNPDLDDISGSYLAKNHLFVVIEFQEKIIGTGGLIFEGQGVGRIVRVSVSAQFRRRGIASQIVNHLVQQARRAQLEKVLVETNLDWDEAISLYQNLGFSEYCRDLEAIHYKLLLK